MRILGYILGLALATSGTVQAQDWDGWYAGLGQESGSYSFSMPTSTRVYILNGLQQSVPDESGDGSGVSLNLGRLWQRDDFVYGLELDLGGPKAGFEAREADPADPSTFCSPAPCLNNGLQTELQTKGHFRAIAGLVQSDKLMVFGSLGVAKASFSAPGIYIYNNINGFTNASLFDFAGFPERTVYGPSLGLGAQYKLSERVSLRGEVLRDSFDLHYDAFTNMMTVAVGPDYGSNYLVTGDSTSGTDFKIRNTSARLSLIFTF